MTPETAAVTWAGIVAALVAAVALLLLVPSVRGAAVRVLLLAIVSGGELVLLGLASGAAAAPYLLDLAAAAAVVMILLLAGAAAAGAGPRIRWLVPVVWGVVVLPATALLPLLATAGCAGTPCALQDFGGAVPLAVAPGAFVILAALVPAAHRGALPEPGSRASLVLGGVLWGAFVVWIAAMEGAVDAYTPVLLLAGAVGPAVAAVAWLLVDRIRRSPRPVARSLLLGVVVGVLATTAGAATVVVPWSLAAALLVGVVAAGVARGRTRSTSRAGAVVLVAAALGLLAPVVSGDAIGILFTAQFETVPVPIVIGGAAALFSAAVSLPVWLVIRSRAIARS